MITRATFSKCGNYRYELSRIWDEDKPYALFVALNPSTADDQHDDPTTRRCTDFARSWKAFGGMRLVNLFAFRATLPEDLMAAKDPVGRANNRWIRRLSGEAGLVIAAWGNHGSYRSRSEAVRDMLPQAHCLRLNASGEPAHPLYLPKTLKPRRWHFR